MAVEILLATHNNARYLEPLLQSLLSQTISDFHLVVSDDCSTDETVAILREHMHRFRNPVRLIERQHKSGSAAANFTSLMQISRGDMVFFCDADDIWNPDKLARFLSAAADEELRQSRPHPIFMFSDAEMIDEAGKVIGKSYWAFKRTDPAKCLHLSRLLVCTPMIGCASMMNRALVELARNVPLGQATGHDWWALLVAACFGSVKCLSGTTIRYRIHPENSSHPMEISVRSLPRLLRPWYEVRRRLDIRRRQAAPLIAQFGKTLPDDAREAVARFLAVEQLSFWQRRLSLIRNGFTYPDLPRNLALLVFS